MNEVGITPECAKDLFEATGDYGEPWYELEDVVCDGKLSFNSDHMEHMDYVWKDEVKEVLKRHRAKGDICFGSGDGDNAGSYWGYRFDGNGDMTELKGVIRYEEVKKPFKDMHVVFTGRLSTITREAAEAKVRKLGGKTSRSVTKKTTHIVCGKNSGSKLKKARDAGAVVLQEDEFLNKLSDAP